MNHLEIVATLNFIRPNAQWSLSDQDLIWLDENQNEPTKKELEDGLIAYQAKIQSDEAEATAKKAAAEAKLAALGLTADDLKALGLG